MIQSLQQCRRVVVARDSLVMCGFDKALCHTSSFRTVAWQLAKLQLTRRIVRSLGYC